MAAAFTVQLQSNEPVSRKKINMKNYDALQTTIGNFGKYQFLVFIFTQLGYLGVTGTMLCTLFDTILPKDGSINCEGIQAEIEHNVSLVKDTAVFRSLLLEMGLVCSFDYLPTSFVTALMFGGIIGATLTGFFADRIGRKWVVIGTLLFVCLFNIALVGLGLIAWPLTLAIMFFMGMSGGGYMVVNLTILLEVIGTQNYRLGATAFNGWPLGMCAMALSGYVTGHWRYYHLYLVAASLICAVAMILTMHESARWLIQHERFQEAEGILKRIAKTNGKKFPANKSLLDILTAVQISTDGKADLFNGETDTETAVTDEIHERTYNYRDLLQYTQIVIYLAALTYSWLASAIVSFGIYFNLNHLYGNPFMKTFLTGLAKGVTGALPFAIGLWVGRKPILLGAVTVTCFSVWAVVGSYLLFGKGSWLMTAFTIIGAASIDPIWKVNHLYSTELFPTVIRTMARAICNVGSRTGSFIGPQVSFLSNYHPAIPYTIFGVLTMIQIAISAVFLPETKGKRLPDGLPEKRTHSKSMRTVPSQQELMEPGSVEHF